MIKAFEIENFKAFKNRQRIPLKPITLIYGPNSAGKSSVIQSLLFFQNYSENNDSNNITIGDSNLDLGNLKNLIHKNNTNKPITFCFSYNMNSNNHETYAREIENIEIEIGIKPTDKNEVIISFYKLKINNELILEYDDKLVFMNFKNEIIRSMFLKFFDISGTNEDNNFISYINFIEKEIYSNNYIFDNYNKYLDFSLIKESDYNKINTQDLLQEEFMVNNFGHIYYGKNSIFKRGNKFKISRSNKDIKNYNVKSEENKTDVKSEGNKSILDAIHIIDNLLLQCFNGIENNLHDIIHIPNIRMHSQRRKDEVSIPLYFKQLKNKDTRNNINNFLKRNYQNILNYSIVEKTWNMKNENIKKNEIFVKDNKMNILLNFEDLGTGFSQILPILIYVCGSNFHRICIEQPELHLHPKLQSQLADDFIVSSIGSLKNQFLIETHSEHLLLRIMKRIRQTTQGGLPDDIPPITPDDVAVLYVNMTENEGSEVLELRLDKDGEFIDPWPDGFFEEGFNDLF